MSTAAILFTFVIVLAALLVAALFYAWWLQVELDRLHGSHARPRARGTVPALPDGAAPAEDEAAGPAPAPRQTSLLAPVNHAQAMRDAAEPYLPDAPAAPWPPADLPVHAEPQQEPRPDVTMSDLPAARPVPDVLPTAAELRDEYFRWKHPVASLSPDCGNGCHAPLCDGRNCSCDCHAKAAAAYGQAPVADVLEAERLARVMQQ